MQNHVVFPRGFAAGNTGTRYYFHRLIPPQNNRRAKRPEKIQTVKKAILFLFLLPFFAGAQKTVDLDKYRFSVQYRSLPLTRIDSTYRTYDLSIGATRLMEPLLEEMDPGQTVRLEGWKKLSDRGHLHVEVKLGDLLPGEMTVRERVVSNRLANGTLSSKTYYYQEVSYSFEALAILSDYRGMHILDEVLADRSHKGVYRSPEFPARAMAEGYFLVNALSVTRNLFRESVTRAMHRLTERLNNHFGFEPVTVNDMMWVIDSRKHDEYGPWRTAIRQASDVLFSMNASTPITRARDELAPVIGYFEKIKKEYSSNNRHDRKIRYGAYYNLAVLYYYLDDPQAMMREANGLELNDFDPGDAKGFKRTATWLKDLFEQNNIHTRHFPIYTEDLKGPQGDGLLSDTGKH